MQLNKSEKQTKSREILETQLTIFLQEGELSRLTVIIRTSFHSLTDNSGENWSEENEEIENYRCML